MKNLIRLTLLIVACGLISINHSYAQGPCITVTNPVGPNDANGNPVTGCNYTQNGCGTCGCNRCYTVTVTNNLNCPVTQFTVSNQPGNNFCFSVCGTNTPNGWGKINANCSNVAGGVWVIPGGGGAPIGQNGSVNLVVCFDDCIIWPLGGITLDFSSNCCPGTIPVTFP